MDTNIKNKFIKGLYDELGVYIVPQDADNSVLEGQSYITYHVITTDLPDQALEVGFEVIDGREYRVQHKQFQESISFHIESYSQEEALTLATRLKDLLEYELAEQFYTDLDLVLLSTSSIQDTSLRVLGDKKFRYNLDLRLRSGRTIKKYVGKIESYQVNYEQE